MRGWLLGLLPLLLAGCLETKETIRLAPDGSGRVLQVTRVDLAKQEASLRAWLALYGKDLGEGEPPGADPLAEAWFRHGARRAPGYRLTLLETRTEKGVRRTTVSGRFGTLRAAAEAGLFPGAAMRLERKGSGGWRLGFRHGWGLVGDTSRGELAGRKVSALVARLAEAFDGWSLDRVVVFPSRVLETNGTVDADGVTVRWRLTIRDLFGASEIEQWARFEDRDDLKLVPFRVAPDPEALVRRLLGRPPKAHSASS